MDVNDLEKLREMVDAVIYSPTKQAAKGPVRKLEFMATQMGGKLDGYASGVLDKVVSYAKEASGQVRNKEHWRDHLDQNWYVLENEIKNSVSGTRK